MAKQRRRRRGGFSFWRLAHWFFFARALSRGPRYFARYELRRQGRKALYRATRRW
jgi:hypothetical protein